jgi:hypothetical protein
VAVQALRERARACDEVAVEEADHRPECGVLRQGQSEREALRLDLRAPSDSMEREPE